MSGKRKYSSYLIDGVPYLMLKDVAAVFGLSVSGVWNRLRNPDFPTWLFVDGTPPSTQRPKFKRTANLVTKPPAFKRLENVNTQAPSESGG